MRQEAEQQRREEADERKRWKRDMRERLTTVHKQLTQHSAPAADGIVDEQRLRGMVDERVLALTAQYERTIADLTHRIQLLESRQPLTIQTTAPPASPSLHHPTALSIPLSPSSTTTTLSYPVRSLSPSQSPHTTQPPQQQQPRGVLKKAVRFNEDVRQRMFTTARAEDEEKERDDDEYGDGGMSGGAVGLGQSVLRDRQQDEDEFDMFQTRTVGRGWSAAPSTVGSGVVADVIVHRGESKVAEDEVKETASESDVQQQQQQQQAAMYNEWSKLATPASNGTTVLAAVEVKEEYSTTSASTSYSYESADDSPQLQQQQVEEEVLPETHGSSGSSSDEEDEPEMDSTDDEPTLELTDLSAATEQPTEDTPTSVEQQHSPSEHEQQQQQPHNPNHTTALAPTTHQPLSAYATTRHTAPTTSTSDLDLDSDSDDEEPTVTRTEPPARSALLSHLPPLSSLQSGGGARYKSSLAIRSTKPATSVVVVGDSEAVQDILTGGRNKMLEEEQKAEVEDEPEEAAAVSTSKRTTRAAAAAAALLDGDSDDSEVEDGLAGSDRGGSWQQASMDGVFGGNSTANKPAVRTDSDDDEDMVVVKG